MAATAKKKKTRQDFSGSISAAVKDPGQQPQADPASKAEERRIGRPSTGKTIKVTLAIPEELIDGVEAASLLHKGNRTAYINSLIRKDLNANLTKYNEFRKMING